MDRLAIITPTYRADHDVAVELSASLDRHVKVPFHHTLLVPRNDHRRFRHLVGPHRSVVVKEDVLGAHGFRRVPAPARIGIPSVWQRRLNEKWWHRKAGFLSGWLVQQLVKLSAPDFVEDEHLLMIDSDVVLVRDLHWHHVRDGEFVRLRRITGGGDIPSHRRWRDNALTLLGRPPEQGRAYNFVGIMIAWRRSHVLRLQREIEAATGQDWRLAIARLRDVSEYILYGYSCQGLPDEATGHRREAFDLSHSLWVDGDAAFERFVAGIGDHHIAVHIQSTLPMTMERRAGLVRRIADGLSLTAADGSRTGATSPSSTG